MVIKGLFFKIVLGFFLISVCLSCSNASSVEGDKNTKEKSETQMKYICPMSCIKGKNEAGTCDICEMNLVLNKNYKEPNL